MRNRAARHAKQLLESIRGAEFRETFAKRAIVAGLLGAEAAEPRVALGLPPLPRV